MIFLNQDSLFFYFNINNNSDGSLIILNDKIYLMGGRRSGLGGKYFNDFYLISKTKKEIRK